MRKVWIEGVGESYSINSSISWEMLFSVLDKETPTLDIGNLFSGMYFGKKPISWKRMVRDDRIWIYGGKDSEGNWYKSYCRFGDPELVGAIEYRPFYEFRRDIWDSDSSEENAIVTDGGFIPPRLIRENGSTVYMFDYLPEKSLYPVDMVLYFFPLEEDVNVYCHITIPFTTEMESFNEIRPREWNVPIYRTRELSSGTHREYQWQYYIDFDQWFVEGIGILRNGFLPYFFDPEFVSKEYMPILLDYCDADGNVLDHFATMDDVHQLSVDCLSDDSITKRSQLKFDLQGRRLQDIIPGVPYIQNGKIHMPK